MRVLVVAMSNSIHTARWLAQICDQGWDVHLFPSYDNGITHPDLRNLTVHHWLVGKHGTGNPFVRVKGWRIPHFKWLPLSQFISPLLIKIASKVQPDGHAKRLARLIRKLRPDVIHSLEIQGAGYLTLRAKSLIDTEFPPWIVTNWGSDIFLYGRLERHARKIREVLISCNYYSCEGHRDVKLARDLGFVGEVLPVIPNTGGFSLERTRKLRQEGLTSLRRVVMLKGYQTWAGRALVGLRALERCASELKGYEIVIFSASTEVELAAELFQVSTGIPVRILPQGTSHEEVLCHHGRARISIGLSISDGISTSFLEAIAMGSFPIQSWTSTASEWIEDGISGFLVPPEDPETIERAIRNALADDHLVDEAAQINEKTVNHRLDGKIIQPIAVQMYLRATRSSLTT